MIYVIIYLIGMFITLTFLKFFGKKFELNDEHDKSYTIDKYIIITILFPCAIVTWMIITLFKLLYKFIKWYAL